MRRMLYLYQLSCGHDPGGFLHHPEPDETLRRMNEECGPCYLTKNWPMVLRSEWPILDEKGVMLSLPPPIVAWSDTHPSHRLDYLVGCVGVGGSLPFLDRSHARKAMWPPRNLIGCQLRSGFEFDEHETVDVLRIFDGVPTGNQRPPRDCNERDRLQVQPSNDVLKIGYMISGGVLLAGGALAIAVPS